MIPQALKNPLSNINLNEASALLERKSKSDVIELTMLLLKTYQEEHARVRQLSSMALLV